MPAEVKAKQVRRGGYDLVRAEADYPARDVPPERSLVVCTQQRSGSTLLGEALYFAGEFGCPLEYFHPGFRPSFTKRWKADRIDTYAASAHRFRTDGAGTFGVKLFWADVEDLILETAPSGEADRIFSSAMSMPDAAYRRVLKSIAPLIPQPRFIYLRRRDQLRQAVSLFIAGKTRRWRKLHATELRPIPAYDFDHIVQFLVHIQNDERHWQNFFRANALDPCEICYEDLESDFERALGALFRELGRPDARIAPPRLHKQADATSEQLLERFLTEFHQRASD